MGDEPVCLAYMETMKIQHILVNCFLLLRLLALTTGNQQFVLDSSLRKTWNDTYYSQENCKLASDADFAGFEELPEIADTGPVWISSDSVLSEWIHMVGCFTVSPQIINQPNQTFTTIESCLFFCDGNFGITNDTCICSGFYNPSSTGCLAWRCSAEDNIFCGDTNKNYEQSCVCEYKLKNTSVRQTDNTDNNCVSYYSNDSSLYAHNCSDEFPPLCYDLGSKEYHRLYQQHQWASAGFQCYSNNIQFFSYIDRNKLSENITYWIAMFRIKMRLEYVPSNFFDSLYCPAVEKYNNNTNRILKPCTHRLPSLCVESQTVSVSSLTPQHVFIFITTVSAIAGVVLLIMISVFIYMKLRRRKKEPKRKEKNPEATGPFLATDPHGNNEQINVSNQGNCDNEIYNVLHEERRWQPDDKGDLYDHSSASNSMYGVFRKEKICGESDYNSMAAIRSELGMYGETVYRNSTSEGEYGHLASLSST